MLDQTADEGTIDLIEQTAAAIVDSADCAIGYEAAAMVLQGVRGFREDYEEHARYGRCICSLKQPVPCVTVCPAHVDIPGYIALVREGQYDDAHGADPPRTTPSPIPARMSASIPCERQCRRRLVDDAVNICGLKRYAARTTPPASLRPRPRPRSHRQAGGRHRRRAQRPDGGVLPAADGPQHHGV